ncbi:cilia- and flagella-associated protein 58 isoform X1 [Plutella xylostella]|nr:cilia- and flagella-associated protein 58 isoform X1 [Plutella xylostella]
MEEEDEETFGELMAVASETTEAEKEYDQILEALREDDALKHIADVVTKLYDCYYQKKGENKKQAQELEAIQARMDRFDDTVTDYQAEISELNKTIAGLRADVEDARTLADAMHARELAGVESLETMRKLVTRLEKELDARRRAGDDDVGATSAVKEKERFEKEITRLQSELDAAARRLESAVEYQRELEGRAQEAAEKEAAQEDKLEEYENNAVRTNRVLEHTKGEVNELKAEIEARGKTIGMLNEKLAKSEKQLERRDKQLHEIQSKVVQATQEQQAALARASHAREQLERQAKECEKSKKTLGDVSKELKISIDDNNRQRTEIAKLNKNFATQVKKYQLLEQAKATSDAERDRLRQQITVMEREIMMSKKQAESDKREIENQQREKDILNNNMQKMQTEAQENLQSLHLQQQRRKQLEHELELLQAQINKQRIAARQMEKEKDRMLEETIALNEKVDDVTDEVRLRMADIVDLKKALREEETRTRQLSASLETARADKNMLHKNYTEANTELTDVKLKMKMLAYQIEQLKEDISGKEVGLRSTEASLSKCNKRVEALRVEVQGGVARLADAKAENTALRQEEGRLNRIIQEGDTARAKLSKELEGLLNERDIIGAQLVRRNDEIALLYEKIRILEVTLHRGERQYEQRVEDIRLLRLEVLRLRKEKNLLARGIENMTDLRLEVFNLERELGRERLRVRALEEALETPINVHRWRKLGGSDPAHVQLTQKLHMIQKKVLSQSEMLVQKDRQLKQTENLYSAVKDMLALQPSPEIQQTLNRTQRALSQRTGKMKCLIAELNMRERQVSDLRLDMERVNSDLTSYKQKYYELKRALDADEARRLKVPSPQGTRSPQSNIMTTICKGD